MFENAPFKQPAANGNFFKTLQATSNYGFAGLSPNIRPFFGSQHFSKGGVLRHQDHLRLLKNSKGGTSCYQCRLRRSNFTKGGTSCHQCRFRRSKFSKGGKLLKFGKKKSQYFAKFAKQNSTLRNICQSYYTARNSENCIHSIAIFSVRQSEDGGKHPCF